MRREKPQAGSLGRAAFLLGALGLSGLGAQQLRHALPTRVQRQQKRGLASSGPVSCPMRSRCPM
jgi:hypothetical protein